VERQLGTFTAAHDSEEEGRRLMVQAAAVLDELGDSEELSSAMQFLGESYRRDGDLETALDFYRRSLPLVQEHIGYKPEVERRIATTLLEMGDVDGAEAMAEQAVADVAADDWSTVASTAMVLGMVRAAQGRLAEAEQLLRSATDVLEDKQFPAAYERLALAELLFRTGRADEGGRWLARAREELASFAPGSPTREFFDKRIAKIEGGTTGS
jgi:tetratricopeptide (TPR) repeat protein